MYTHTTLQNTNSLPSTTWVLLNHAVAWSDRLLHCRLLQSTGKSQLPTLCSHQNPHITAQTQLSPQHALGASGPAHPGSIWISTHRLQATAGAGCLACRCFTPPVSFKPCFKDAASSPAGAAAATAECFGPSCSPSSTDMSIAALLTLVATLLTSVAALLTSSCWSCAVTSAGCSSFLTLR